MDFQDLSEGKMQACCGLPEHGLGASCSSLPSSYLAEAGTNVDHAFSEQYFDNGVQTTHLQSWQVIRCIST